MNRNDGPRNVEIDIGDTMPLSDSQEDDLEYLRYLYEPDGTPMVKKIMALQPFKRIVRLEPSKSFFEKLLELFKA
jgi:hypothetical protein